MTQSAFVFGFEYRMNKKDSFSVKITYPTKDLAHSEKEWPTLLMKIGYYF